MFIHRKGSGVVQSHDRIKEGEIWPQRFAHRESWHSSATEAYEGNKVIMKECP